MPWARLCWLSLIVIITACSQQAIKAPAEFTALSAIIRIGPEAQLQLNQTALQQWQQEQPNAEVILAQWLLAQASVEPALASDTKFSQLHAITGQWQQALEDDFSQALAAFLFDENYACGAPSRARYFQQRYPQLERSTCSKPLPFRLLSNLGEQRLVWVEPERVHSVHLLFSGNGPGIASKFGHMSLRFVICPTANSSEQACQRNLSEHLVVGYRAHVNELAINNFKGLMGDYQAYLYAFSFMDVYQQYAITEFRELQSLPLKLSPVQRQQLVELMAEVHWSFAGQYKFLTQNCSSYMQQSINWIMPEQKQALTSLYWRPDKYFAALEKSHLASGELLQNKAEAEKQGYYFPSTRSAYKKAFAMVQQAMSDAEFNNLEHYIRLNPAHRSQAVFADKPYYQRLQQDKLLLQAQLLIEELSLLRYEAMMMAGLSAFVEKNDIAEIQMHLQKALNAESYETIQACFLKPIKAMTQPVEKKHGIPATPEVSINNEFLSCGFFPQQSILSFNQALMDLDAEAWANVINMRLYWQAAFENIEHYENLILFDREI